MYLAELKNLMEYNKAFIQEGRAVIRKVTCPKCGSDYIISMENCEDIIEMKEIECATEGKTNENNYNEGVLTTLVRIKGAECKVVPVKSSKPINKKMWVECSKALSRIYVGAPIKIGDIVCSNILNTGVDIICARNMKKQA